MFGLNKFYWILIRVAGGALGLLILALFIGKEIYKSDRDNKTNPPVTTIVHNNTIINPQSEASF